VILAVAAVAAVIAAVLLAKTLLKSGGNSVSTQVPVITGQTLAQAQQSVATANQGLTGTARWTLSGSNCGAGKNDAATPANQIISQDPAASGFMAPQAISYCISLGVQAGQIPAAPALAGMTEDQLKALLKQQGFAVDGVVGVTVANATVKAGNIVDVLDANSQSSVAGKSVPISTVLTWNISGGPGTVPVPDVTNEAYTDAKAALEQQKFQVAEIQAYDPNIVQGNVISMNPPANSQQAPGTKITLTVSKGPQPDNTPPNCNPATDPNQCQGTQPSTTPSSQGNNPGGPGGPGGGSPTTKKGN
jgi:serine/threonine-protein kinase